MTAHAEHLLREVLNLPADERADIVSELLASLDEPTEEEIRPLDDEGEDLLMGIAAEIDSVYSKIHGVVAQGSGGPDLKKALRPLRRRLEALQEREADAMERRFRTALHFDPEQARQLVERAERLRRRK